METAAKHATELQAKHKAERVYKMQTKPNHKAKFPTTRTNDKGNSCYKCNKPRHPPHKCRFNDSVYYNCNKRGHIKKACRSKVDKPNPQTKPIKKKVYALETDTDSDNCIASLETYEMNNKNKLEDAIRVTPTVEERNLKWNLILDQ